MAKGQAVMVVAAQYHRYLQHVADAVVLAAVMAEVEAQTQVRGTQLLVVAEIMEAVVVELRHLSPHKVTAVAAQSALSGLAGHAEPHHSHRLT